MCQSTSVACNINDIATFLFRRHVRITTCSKSVHLFVNVEFDFFEIFVLITPLFFFSLQDHIQEVLDKWHQIDDEIWAKLIVMERNRRVAKAYARAIPIQINGSDDGFDGFRY